MKTWHDEIVEQEYNDSINNFTQAMIDTDNTLLYMGMGQ